MEKLYEIRRKSNNELLSTGLTKEMLDYLRIIKNWDLTQCVINVI